MVKTTTAAFDTHLLQDLTTIATGWKITRTDGVVIGFTDHDIDIVIDSVTYLASSGYIRSAISSSASMNADNMEVHGFLDDTNLTSDDLRNGLYNFAQVEIFAYNWADVTPTMGTIALRFGHFGEVTIRPSGEFKVELRGLVSQLGMKIGNIYQPECPLDLGETKCSVALKPPLRFGLKDYALGDRILVPFADSKEGVQLAVTNPGFETGDTTGWTFPVLSHTARGSNNVLMAKSGSYYMGEQILFTGADTEFSQTVSIEPGAPITTTKIDALDYKIRFKFNWAAEVWGMKYRARIYFQDGAFAQINSGLDDFVQVYQSARPYLEWFEDSIDVDIPTGTRNVVVELQSAIDTDIATWGDTQMGYDDLSVCILDKTYETADDYSRFSNIEFECTTAGASALVRPTFDTTLGNTTADGTVTWTARKPRYTFYDVVAAVSSQTVFTATNIAEADDVFNWGVLEWLTGNNVGRRIEVKDWLLSSSLFTIALAAFYEIQVGDTYTVHVGCDKSRSALTGCKFFDNVINFGGHPEVPGTDKFFKVGGASTEKC